jgi:hypothetical protein
VAARAPTGDYGIDVHIDTGVLGLSTGGLLSAVQELFVTPVWMAMVWLVHALVVMLEWCFTIDLLDSPSVRIALARSLRQAQAAFTEPWLASVLAVGAVLAAYHGLIRRRIAETIGQALLTMIMMAVGMWVMLDPSATAGALSSWANQASLGTLAATASGTPNRASQTLADSMGELFSTAVEAPWCYLEFGDVGWCRNPARLDPRLRAAALSIAAGELAIARCRDSGSPLRLCSALGSGQIEALEHSAQLLRSARSNGAIFLALPANGSQRNAISERGSLLWAICQNDDATSCRGATTAQAEFRTNRGTWPRVGGLLLILAGALGMLLLFGFLALRLLAAALFSLLYLLLAPAAVLAPALGDGGRELFRRWASRLIAALLSKLVFSFILGAILAVLGILSNLEALGWWTQWLLMSAFWWAAFVHRHQALEIAGGRSASERRGHLTLVRRTTGALDSPRRAIGGVRAAKQRREQRRQQRLANRESEYERDAAPVPPPLPPPSGRVAATEPVRGERERALADEQVRRMSRFERRDAQTQHVSADEADERLKAMRARLARIQDEQERARAAGDVRRMAVLAGRGARVDEAMRREQSALAANRRVLGERGTGDALGAEHVRAHSHFLDAQAALAPSKAWGRAAGARRDYAALAPLAGYARSEYEALDRGHQRSVRLQIDRELASRSEAHLGSDDWVAPVRPSPRRPSPVPRARSDLDLPTEPADEVIRPARRIESESSVMRDAREVAARRKRQLGRGRP